MRVRFLLACLLVPLLAEAQAPGPASGAARAVLTLAEQPLRLIRGAVVYKAAAGVAVQKDDILETGAAGVQVEAGPNAMFALGPQTRVLVLDLPPGGKAAELALLQGWVKLMADTGKPAQVLTPALQLTLASGSAIVRSNGDGRDAVFAEEGAQQAA
jgi:hypothetical protein